MINTLINFEELKTEEQFLSVTKNVPEKDILRYGLSLKDNKLVVLFFIREENKDIEEWNKYYTYLTRVIDDKTN